MRVLPEELMKMELRPREGDKVDQAHPAIYPTGEHPRKLLYSQELKLFDLIVRRFLACFAEDAIRERTSAEIHVGEDKFSLTGRRTLRSGWIKYYSRYTGIEDKLMPKLNELDELGIVKIECDEVFESRPARFNQGSLLEKMERESIGTKATRADIISTLTSRGYIAGNIIEATDLGLSVIEIMREYSPQIISTSLTRETEKELEEIENGSGDETGLIEKSIGLLAKQIALLKASEIEIGNGDEAVCDRDHSIAEHNRFMPHLQDRQAENHKICEDSKEICRVHKLSQRLQGFSTSSTEGGNQSHQFHVQ